VSVRVADGRIHATTDRIEPDAITTDHPPQEDPDE
jgi:hypothetical protein